MNRKRLSPTKLLLFFFLLVFSSPSLAYYDPGVQRWINRDPIEESGGCNLHAFVFNNPVSNIDPFGDSVEEDLNDPNSKNELCKDPCKGLRKQLKLHEEKYRKYLADPDSMDNLGLLEGLTEQERNRIIAGRLSSLLKQIKNFRKQLEDCETKHGIR